MDPSLFLATVESIANIEDPMELMQACDEAKFGPTDYRRVIIDFHGDAKAFKLVDHAISEFGLPDELAHMLKATEIKNPIPGVMYVSGCCLDNTHTRIFTSVAKHWPELLTDAKRVKMAFCEHNKEAKPYLEDLLNFKFKSDIVKIPGMADVLAKWGK